MRAFLAVVVGLTAVAYWLFFYSWLAKDHFDPLVLGACAVLTWVCVATGRRNRR